MRKIIMIASVLMAAILFMPTKAEAAEYESGPISFPAFGAVEAEWDYASEDDREDGIKTWSFYFTPNKTTRFVYITLTPVNLNIQSVRTGDSFIAGYRSSNNTEFLLEVTSSSGIASGERVLLFTVITEDAGDPGDPCQLNPGMESLNCSTDIEGFYFNDEGESISAAEYEEVCGNPTTPSDDPDDIPNSPQTGSAVPYIAIGGGLLAIIVVYLFSRKHNKVYKI